VRVGAGQARGRRRDHLYRERRCRRGDRGGDPWDAPVSKAIFQLKSGKKNGLFVNSANIYKTANQAIVKIAAHNGKRFDSKPRVATSCKKK